MIGKNPFLRKISKPETIPKILEGDLRKFGIDKRRTRETLRKLLPCRRQVLRCPIEFHPALNDPDPIIFFGPRRMKKLFKKFRGSSERSTEPRYLIFFLTLNHRQTLTKKHINGSEFFQKFFSRAVELLKFLALSLGLLQNNIFTPSF